MFRFRLLLFATLPLLAVHSALASNFAVGTCKPKLPSFTTISAAVSTVPPGSTVFVCPGTYPEQVTISQSLNLQGIGSANQNEVMIAVPSTGLVGNAASVFGEAVAAQVLVQSAGPVNITDITVDGTGGNLSCASNTWVAGIFYASGSSGVVHQAKASNQIDGGCGVGIWAESDGTTSPSVTVEGSSVHDNDNTGIFAVDSGSTPTLSVLIRGNVVSVNSGLLGIGLQNVAGTVTSNDVSSGIFGIVDSGSAVTLSWNTVSQTGSGFFLEDGGTILQNNIYNAAVGIWFITNGGTAQSNRITSTTQAAVEFSCNTATVVHNTINDALVGLDNAPLGVGVSNIFNNTATANAGSCAVAALRANAAPSSATPGRAGASIWQWRTPASPFGTPR